MGDNTLGVSFTTGEAIPFDVNDYVDFEGERYTLMSVPCPRQASTVEYEYTLRFHGVENELSKALCFLMTDGGMDSDFALTDGPATHLQLVVDNINRIKGSTAWRIGSVIAADYKVITYDGIDCLTALNRIAETFETEWWIVGTTIYLGKCEHGELLELGYAADGTAVGGLLNMSKREEENDSFFTRLYAKGSTRNIDRSRYGSDYLHLPSPLRYLEKNTGYGIVEREVIFDTVYPRRVGTLSGVRSIERESEGKTIRVYYVTDRDIPFDPNDHEIAGLTKHVKFETGELSGYDLEANYDSSTGEFELINQYPDENTQIPDGVMVPKAGDTYILYNIRMPDEYYALAENELGETAEAYLDRHSVDSSVYSGDSDPIIMREREVTVTLGQRVRLYNPVFFSSGYRDSRIIGFTRNLNDPYDVKVDISEYVSIGRMESLERKVDSFLPMISQAGGSINIIKSGDDTAPTDNNVFSALKAISTFLRKDQPDQTNYLLKLLGGLISDNIESRDFAAGPFGTGFVLKRNAKTGKSYMEIDELYVRLKAYFDTLEIKHLSHVGGRVVLSPAAMECIRVEEVSAEYETVYDSTGTQVFDSSGEEILAPVGGGEMAYRCYFKQTDGEREIVNEFAVDDLAQCREFNVKPGISHHVRNQYYWRRVLAVGDDYIDLSMSDCDPGSMEPKAGDTIVTIGNKTDKSRQHVVFLSSYDEDAPCIKLYSGINSYSMLNKEVTVISPNADKNVFTGKMVIKPGSTGFENLTDAPDMGEVNEAIQDAKNTASNAQEAVNGVQGSVTSLKGYVDGAFSDGIISEAEARGIEKYLNIVGNEKISAESTFNKLYANPYLEGSAKVSLSNAKAGLLSSISALAGSINSAIADGKTTVAEKADVDKKFAAFNTATSTFKTAVETANESIQSKLKGYSDEAQKAADEANNTASSAMEGVNEAKGAVSDLNKYVDGAFSDGIISEAEAKSIERYINTVNQTKKEADSTYTALYINGFLSGTAKSNLYTAKNGLNTATSDLIASINAAIADGKTTTAEKDNVDSKFTAFNNAYASLATAIENANKAIQRKIKEEAVNESKNSANSQIGTVSTAMKEEIAKQLGYGSYSDFEAAAKRGESITEGGSINSKLINAELMITSALIASAIRTNELNVNNKFIVYTDGSVSVEGQIDSLGNDSKAELSNGYFRILRTNTSILPGYVDEAFRIAIDNSSGVPEISMVDNSNRTVSITPRGITFHQIGFTKTLTIDPSVLGGGTIKKTSDGMLYLSEDGGTKSRVEIKVSGEGTTSPLPGIHYCDKGSIVSLYAYPASGYEFEKWSDNGSQNHDVTARDDERTYTVYFKKKSSANTYRLTLDESPSNGGTTSGEGTYSAGTNVRISATPNNGWRFVRWNDGGAQSHTVTMNGNKTLTAYFERYAVTGDEIFQGTALTSSTYWKGVGSDVVYSVAGGMAIFSMSGKIDGSSYIIFNKGYMGSKLEQGHRYRITLTIKASMNDVSLIALMGNALDIPSSVSEDALFYGGYDGTLTTSYKTISAEFTVKRDSTIEDGFLFIVSMDCTVGISSISLKEI